MNYRIGHSRYRSYQEFQKEYGKDIQTDDSTDYIDPIAGNKAVSAKRARFVREYPYADMKRFKFEPMISSNGDIGVVIWFVDVDGISSYDIMYDGFKKDKEFTAYLTSLRPALKVTHAAALKPASTGWPRLWSSSGSVQGISFTEGDPVLGKYPPITKISGVLSNFKVYVNSSEFFYSNLPKISNYIDLKSVPVEFDYDVSYYTAICATYVSTYLCGVSTYHTTPHNNVNPIITSIMNFHVYLWIRRFLKNPKLLKFYEDSFRVIKNNTPVKGVWDINKYTDSRASLGVLIGRFRNEGRTIRNLRYAKNTSGRIVGSSYDELSHKEVLANLNSYLRYFATKSNGLVDTSLIQESLQCYMYSVLGAQANTRWAIVGRGTSSQLAQKNFRKLVEDMVVQTDINVGITNMRTAIRDTNVIVNAALNPSIILFPSNLVILKDPIPGYNNILLKPNSTVKFGVNNKVNYVGIKQDNPPKKQHQDSAPIHHLDTLGGDTTVPGYTPVSHSDTNMVPKMVHTTPHTSEQRGVVKNRESSGGALAGLGIGAITVFTLMRLVV